MGWAFKMMVYGAARRPCGQDRVAVGTFHKVMGSCLGARTMCSWLFGCWGLESDTFVRRHTVAFSPQPSVPVRTMRSTPLLPREHRLATESRRNELSWRPHSWHATKFTDSHPEMSVSQFATPSPCPWQAQHHASSSQDLSSSWDHTNLQRTSEHFSSLGSVDSLDHPSAPSSGRLSAAKSNGSIDRLGGPSQRDSAYGSFSTSSSTPDHTLARADAACTDSTLLQAGLWEAARPGASEQGQVTGDSPGLEERLGGCLPCAHREPPRSPGQEDHPETKPPPPGRPSFGPIWYVPDKRKAPSSPPPPPPPLRSDSFTAIKGHEKAQAAPFLEAASTQHSTVLAGAQAWGDWRAEPTDLQLRLVPGDGRRTGSLGHSMGSRLDGTGLLPCEGVAGRLQASLSITDIRVVPSGSGCPHPRQYSDEGPFLQEARGPAVLPRDQHGPRASHLRDGSPNQGRGLGVTTKQPGLQLWEESHECGLGADRTLGAQGCPPTAPVGQKPRCRLPQPAETREAVARGRGCPPPGTAGEGWPAGIGAPQRTCHGDKAGQRKVSEDFKWGDGAGSKICAQKTPLLHCLTQEGKSRPAGGQEGGAEKLLPFDAQAGKPTRRSDRFATTLRNEIQLRRARLQQSRSSANLARAPDAGEEPGGGRAAEAGAAGACPGAAFPGTYKDHLKEAQARVLRATSFQRRDLDPGPADRYPGCPGHRPGGRCASPSAAVQPGAAPPASAGGGALPALRVGGRRRFTAAQKLKSYSEPEKIHEVGLSGGRRPQQHPDASEDTVGTFADRWKFFEETSKPAPPRPGQRHAACGLPREPPEKARTAGAGCGGSEPWHQKRARTASFGEPLSGRGRAEEKAGQCERPQRLGTFAEYQASWKEQRKAPEARSAGRSHSADDILDVGLEQHEKPQCVHGRSRSSPSTDRSVQEASIEPQRHAGAPCEHGKQTSSMVCPPEGCAALRSVFWGFGVAKKLCFGWASLCGWALG
ncbi:protein Shroom2 isoform X2 [Tamandua tetradactyla]|uniref:protein Shroom2 isoform X2 n=1 Tax=Tamandua tetradactyla TaxID=48850 RepID=UPI0040539ADD